MIRMPYKTVITSSMKKNGEKKKSKRDIYIHMSYYHVPFVFGSKTGQREELLR